MSERPKTLRCAIYTRKSSEEGLEQDFNSLDAQREACEAYILSQRHEGWKALKDAYDDGGYSGGSMGRPALQKLLADIRARLVDVVVVYKVDRLTRSLSDFARIVEVFDAQGVSFVSVTQQFNTTSSMGRLTLNVLLSFAQFEREVTGERIRDKIAASKKKGLWMGGCVPIGYDSRDRTLAINNAEAETIRTIFRLYGALKNVRHVQAEVHQLNLSTKSYVAKSGRRFGGRPFSRGHIYKILSNPIYVGEIEHKGIRHPGQHPAIIEPETWAAVQTQLRDNGHANRTRRNARERSLLAGLLFDEQGVRLIASHAVKNGKRYRYYEEPPSTRRALDMPKSRRRIAANDIESVVLDQLVKFLTDEPRLTEALDLPRAAPGEISRILGTAERIASHIGPVPTPERDGMISAIARIVLGHRQISIELKPEPLRAVLMEGAVSTRSPDTGQASIVIETAIEIAPRSGHTVFARRSDPAKSGPHNPALIKAIARSQIWFDMLVDGRATSITEIARQEGVTDRYVGQLLRFTFLAPKIIEGVLEGRRLPAVALKRLVVPGEIEILWDTQIAKRTATETSLAVLSSS